MSFENNDFSLFANFPHPVFLISPDGTILETNHYLVENYFREIKEIRGRNIFELISNELHAPESSDRRKAVVDTVVSTGQHIIFDEDAIVGGIIRSSVYPVKSPDGKVSCLLIIVHDVTVEVEAERQARHTDHIYKALLDAIPGSVFVLDEEGHLISGNQYAFTLFGDWRGEIKNKNFHNLVFSEDRPRVKELLSDLMGSVIEKTDEVRMHTHQDRNQFNWFRIHSRKTVIDNRNYLVLVCIDITELKFSESHLFEYKKWLIKAMEAGNTGVWEWNLETNDGFWSNSLWNIFGIEKLPGLAPSFELWQSTIHPDDRDIVVESVTKAISIGAELNIQYRVLHYDGSCRWLLEAAKPVRDKKGNLKRYSGIAIDITKQKKLEDETVLLREHLDILLEKFNIGWFYMNLEDQTAIRTIEHARIFGYDSLDADWSFDKFLGHVVDEDKEKMRNILVEMISNHKDTVSECQIVTTNGERRRLLSSNTLLFDEYGKPTHLVGVVQDITDRHVDMVTAAKS